MKYILSILFTFFVISLCQSQDITLSEKHQKRLDKQKDRYKKELLYRKFRKKDSIKFARKQKALLAKKAKATKTKLVKKASDISNDKLDQVPSEEKLKKGIAKKGEKVVEEKFNVEIPEGTSTNPEDITQKLKKKGEQIIEEKIEVDISDVKVDSTGRKQIVDNAKKLSGEAIEERLDIELPEIPTDSTAVTNEISSKVKKVALEEVNDKIDLDISGVTIDSTLKDKTKDKVKGLAAKEIKNELNVDVGNVKIDSTLTDQIKIKATNTALDKAGDELGVDIPDIKVDSTLATQVKNKTKDAALEKVGDEIGVDIPDIKVDSTLATQVKNKTKDAALGKVGDEIGMDVTNVSLDSAGRAKLKMQAEQKAESMLRETSEFKALEDLKGDGELGKLDQYKSQLEKTQQELKAAASRKELKKRMVGQARDYVAQNYDKIQQLQTTKIAALKKKYSYVPNSNDLSTARKRSSLEGESLWKRLVLGGNFNVSETNPLNIDLSPVLGYKVNKLFEIGITGAYRASFKADKGGVGSTGQRTYGYSTFANYMVFKNFFGYVEGERIYTPDLQSEPVESKWNQTLLAGIGRRFSISKWLEMQTIITYNFLHDNKNGPYNSPVVFKTGVRFKK